LEAEPGGRNRALDSVPLRQSEIQTALKRLHDEHSKVEGYQEAILLLYELESAAAKVQVGRDRAISDEERKRRIEKILKKGGRVEQGEEQ
jgi:hypothetical protein